MNKNFTQVINITNKYIVLATPLILFTLMFLLLVSAFNIFPFSLFSMFDGAKIPLPHEKGQPKHGHIDQGRHIQPLFHSRGQIIATAKKTNSASLKRIIYM